MVSCRTMLFFTLIFTFFLTALPATAQVSIVPDAQEESRRIFTQSGTLLDYCLSTDDAEAKSCDLFIEAFIYSLALPTALDVVDQKLICMPRNAPVPREYIVSLLTTYLQGAPDRTAVPAVATLWNLFVEVGWAGASCQ